MADKTSVKDYGYYFFKSGFDNDTVTPVIEWIVEENFKTGDKRKSQLTLVINSPGGRLHSAFALIDTMKGSSILVNTIGLGMIASCGLLTFMAGAKRMLTPNTMILSHQYSGGSLGKEHELFSSVKRFDLTSEMMLKHYKKCTNLSKSEIKKYLLPPEDRWLTAKEAVKYGIADQIVETY